MGFARLAICLLLFLAGCAENEAINAKCTAKYPGSYVARLDCILNSNKEAREFETIKKREIEAQKREAEARPCVAKDLVRMETVAQSLSQLFTREVKIEKLPEIFSGKVLGGQVVHPADNIRESVYAGTINTNCNSAFHFLVNARFDSDGKAKWLKFWAQNAPEGYDHGIYSSLALAEVDFEEQDRAQERIRRAVIESKRRKDEEREAAARSKFLKENDPCEPGISRSERLEKLSAFGPVREIGRHKFAAGEHEIQFSFTSPNSILWCK